MCRWSRGIRGSDRIAAGAGRINVYWRAANDLPVGQIYLSDNPLLRRPQHFCCRTTFNATFAESLASRRVGCHLGITA